jgi:hypothetical protein
MVKKAVFVLMLGIILFSFSLIAAINLEVTPKPFSDAVIIDTNQPAVFDLTIKNLGPSESFSIYSTVGVNITPSTPITIANGKSETVRVYLMPNDALKTKIGTLPFEYKIKNSKDEIQTETLTIRILGLGDVFNVVPSNINIKSEKIKVTITNTANVDFSDLTIKMNSIFFTYDSTLPLKGLETKTIEIPLNKDQIIRTTAGSYLVSTEFSSSQKSGKSTSSLKFLEQEDIESSTTEEGWIIHRYEVIKRNVGNVKKTVSIEYQVNLLSYLFTTVNVAPTSGDIKNFNKYYVWDKELSPNEELKIVATTNWLYPIIIILLLIAIVYFVRNSIKGDLTINKNVSFVRTKGGQFALKVMITLKANKFIEKINVSDRLPALVELYDKYGAIPPDKVDLKNKRLDWNLESLNVDEERIFSYIIYSKIGIIGKFELPSVAATYERDGKLKKATSNKAFFINEPKKN